MSGRALGDDHAAVDAVLAAAVGSEDPGSSPGQALEDWQLDWIDRQVERVERWGAETLMSVKERRVLESIAEALGEDHRLDSGFLDRGEEE